ncbi:epidermal growth factor-like protein 8, partial [Sceloporus undulatus]|uniref:epidermal growth factor-like protein 8 n=1 Tax=Sceloporus undulatus TaxID=8520 RepID=UPI001C4B4418
MFRIKSHLVFQLYSHFSLIPLLSGQALAIQETIPNEIQELQAKVEKLEERLERAISVLPSPLEPTQLKELWSRLQYLDQVESLSDQLLFLEEKLGDCEYPKDHGVLK